MKQSRAKKSITFAEYLPKVILLDVMPGILKHTDGISDDVNFFETGQYKIESGNFEADRGTGLLTRVEIRLKIGVDAKLRSPYLQPELAVTLKKEIVEKSLAQSIIDDDLDAAGLDPSLYETTDFTFKWQPLNIKTETAQTEEEKTLVTAYYPIKTLTNTIKEKELSTNGTLEPVEMN